MRKLIDWLNLGSGALVGVAGFLPSTMRAIHDACTAPPAGAGPGHRVRRGSGNLIGLLCVLLVILLAVIDCLYIPRISFTLFYLLLVALASWTGGRKTGIFMAFMVLLALIAHEFAPSDEPAFDWPLVWNIGVQMSIYLFAALLVSAVRHLTESLEWRVRDRTLSLEHEISDRRQTEEQLRKTTQQFRQLAENIADAFWMRDSAETRMVYVSPAYEHIWGRSCRELYQSPNAWLEAIHPEDRQRVARGILTKQAAGEYNEEYRIVRPDGSWRWIRDRAFPIRDSAGRVVRIVGIAEDITDRRRLEREILEISDREQARMGQDLHDGLCQKLVSLAFDSGSLEQRLSGKGLAESGMARQMGAVLDDLITEARALARGLFPVQLEVNGLGVALGHLAAGVSARWKVDCRAECPQPGCVRDNAMATHLYRIAQEAANNAAKHAKASLIRIRLRAAGDRVELKVSDDGVGIERGAGPGGGMGMHIMDYRARTIGGALTVEPGPEGGTVVTCVVQQQPG